VRLDGIVLQDRRFTPAFNPFQLVARHRARVRKIKAQTVGRNQRARLLDLLAEQRA